MAIFTGGNITQAEFDAQLANALASQQGAIDGKAAIVHAHVITDIAGLQAALDAKTSSDHTHALNDLTDVDETVMPTDGQSLVYQSGKWIPVMVAAGGVVDHGALQNLTGDHHTQYFNQMRGDERYYTQTWIDVNLATLTQLNDGLATRALSGHAHALSDLSNVGSVAPTDGQALVWNDGANEYRPATINSGGGVTDHAALTGLGNDDHPHYLNQTRGDARYYTQAQLDAALAGKATAISRVTIAADHTAVAEQRIAVDTDIAAVTITAPATPAEGIYFFVGDAGGNASNNNITIDFGAETFDGSDQDFVININAFGSGFLFNDGEWELWN